MKRINMKLKNFVILVVAAAVFGMMTVGTASAATYQWQNVDWSKLTSSGNAPWYSYVNSQLNCATGDTLVWQNTCENDWLNKYVYPRVSSNAGFSILDTSSIGYHYAWCPDGSVTAASGWHAINVGHWYGNSYGSQEYASSGPQLISQPYQAS
jgi:hypothetical protein